MAVKVGMVTTLELACAIVDALEGFSVPVVFDPVLGASAGGALFSGDPTGLLPLVRRASLVTPNLAEAGALVGQPAPSSLDDARVAGRRLRASGAAAVLVKGGHLPGDAVDLLFTADAEHVFSAPRAPGPSPRGTGCALATAIAVELAAGRPLVEAVAAAKRWLTARIGAAVTVGTERHLP